jgi:hypothetical protein
VFRKANWLGILVEGAGVMSMMYGTYLELRLP